MLATAKQTKIKRLLKMLLSIDNGSRQPGSEWQFKLEGKLDTEMTEKELLAPTCSAYRFLSFFERIKIEFPGNESIYQTINWIKAKAVNGSTVDCLSVKRRYHSTLSLPFSCRISLQPDYHPKKYKLSSQLQQVLGTSLQEETRTKIIGALWQYIKSNRLQESDETKYLTAGGGAIPSNANLSATSNPQPTNILSTSGIGGSGQNTSREFINANSPELMAIFGASKIQFHQLMEKLKFHLFEVDPIVIEFEIGSPSPDASKQVLQKWFQLPVECFSATQQRLIDFVAKFNYEFTEQDAETEEQFMGV